MRVTAEAKNATRNQILNVAQKQFAQRGFEATTTRDIARAANIGVGTLFNYFPTKESIVDWLVGDACRQAAEAFSAESNNGGQSDAPPSDSATQIARPASLEEDLFSHIAATMRKLKPYRKYLPAALETSLSPLALDQPDGKPSLRATHLETVSRIMSQHGQHEALSAIALQLYWTLYTGVLAFWAKDSSPKQEDTLALLDQSLAMFVGWLSDSNHSKSASTAPKYTSGDER